MKSTTIDDILQNLEGWLEMRPELDDYQDVYTEIEKFIAAGVSNLGFNLSSLTIFTSSP